MKFRHIFSMVLLLFSINNLLAQKTSKKPSLVKLMSGLVGKYSNQNQAKFDSSYPMVHLNIQPVKVNQDNNNWLLFEFSNSSNDFDSCFKFLFQIFELNDSVVVFKPFQFSSNQTNWNIEKTNFNELTPKMGCAIFLKKVSHHLFVGQTHGIDCKINEKANGFQTISLSLNKNEINWWNIGYDSLGNQVWGNTKGGYIFNKTNK